MVALCFPMNSDWSTIPGAVVVGAVLLFLVGCSDPGAANGGSVADGSDTASGEGLALAVPGVIAQSRAIDLEALSVQVTIDGRSLIPTRDDGAFVLTETLPPGQEVLLVVDWNERFEGADLAIATWAGRIGPLESDEVVTLDPADYNTAMFDEDEDGLSNIEERNAGSNPRDANDPGSDSPTTVDDAPGTDADTGPGTGGPDGEVVPDVFVRRFDSRGADFSIDGVWLEFEWQRAQFQNTSREELLVNQLVATSENPNAGDGEPNYRWFVMHDTEYLYLFVQLGVLQSRPVNDSADLQNDDALHVFIDGDNSRGRELDGIDGDDRYFAIPLVSDTPGATPQAVAPSSLAPVVPPSLEIGACVCQVRRSGWEMRIALTDLNIVGGRPFGIEIQIDRDINGGSRDARWGWSHPSVNAGESYIPDSPSFNGIARLNQ